MVRGRDFQETYAPVTQLVSIKLFYCMAMHYGLDTFNVDVKSAFLQADKFEEIWVKLPEDFLHEGKFKFCRCAKAIPGMKDSGYLWNKKLVEVLFGTGFNESKVEPCFYYLFGEFTCLLLIHVDNIMVAASDRDMFDSLILAEWRKHFPVEYVSDVSLLGVHVERESPTCVTMHQPHYVDQLIDECGLSCDEHTPVNTPLKKDIEKRFNPEDMHKKNLPDVPFRSIVMKLMWIARCYLGMLMYAACFFARFSSCFTVELFDEMMWTVRYLKGIKEWKLKLPMQYLKPFNVQFFCD